MMTCQQISKTSSRRMQGSFLCAVELNCYPEAIEDALMGHTGRHVPAIQ